MDSNANTIFKHTVDKFLTTRYKFLKQTIHNIMGRKRAPDREDELLQLLVLQLYSLEYKKTKTPFDIERIEPYSVKWLHTQATMTGSSFNYQKKFDFLSEYNREHISEYMADVIADEQVEYREDDAPEDIEHLRSHYTDKQIHKIHHIERAYHKLPEHFKILYDLYFTENYNQMQIAKQTKISIRSVNSLIKELKTEILKEWKQ